MSFVTRTLIGIPSVLTSAYKSSSCRPLYFPNYKIRVVGSGRTSARLLLEIWAPLQSCVFARLVPYKKIRDGSENELKGSRMSPGLKPCRFLPLFEIEMRGCSDPPRRGAFRTIAAGVSSVPRICLPKHKGRLFRFGWVGARPVPRRNTACFRFQRMRASSNAECQRHRKVPDVHFA